ncbi:MAG: YkgJ family cysteine cluster protein [Bryobacteraceae bacterium]
MLTDLVQIERLGEKMRGENEKFRRHLKTHGFADRKFRKLAEGVEREIDCTVCANCCRVATVELIERDVEKLMKYLRISESTFYRDYTMETEDEGVILKRTDEGGCVFLSGNECTVYDARPATCEHFPHTIRGKGSIEARMWQFIDRACYCPIVFNTLEAWKGEVGFRK